eukprot:GEMP01003021.1.p1 GENE.GEMP01003021.1~~GEMP01003021.1.p1  ORF type:complete len:1246 (+),score=297.79 GEMP01003021.1:113-3850(+)
MRQVCLIPSGVQGWYANVISASPTHFAYASTLAIHVYSIDTRLMVKIIANHARTISCIAFCPYDSDKIASCSVDGKLAIWSIGSDFDIHGPDKVNGIPIMIDWAREVDSSVLAVAYENHEVRLWDLKDKTIKKAFFASYAIKVMRWHPTMAWRLISGHADGTLILYDHPKKKTVDLMNIRSNAVEDCQWDPNSSNYLLVSYQDGQLHMFDVEDSKGPIVVFERTPQGVKYLAWVPNQPGTFLSVTDKVGVLKIWNVSQRFPVGQLKVGVGGIFAIKATPQPRIGMFLLSYKNGSVGLLDFTTRKMVFTSAPGHSETIFDIAFHPADQDIFATASYDGYVKLWRISTAQSFREIFSDGGHLLYAVAYNHDGSMLAAVASTGFAFVWNDKGEELSRHETHKGSSIFRCSWHPTQPMLLSGGSDSYACLVSYEMRKSPEVKLRLRHPASVIGVQFDRMGDLIATGCHDGLVRIFHPTSGVNIAELRGHTARAFNISWHPIAQNVLASGSDDKTIRIWDVGHGAVVKKLSGHKNFVRALLWHTECVHILISGSWDASIRVWNVITETCLHVCAGHHADVYGIASHPSRPFLFVSCSRDTSLRFWSYDSLADKYLVKAMVNLTTDPIGVGTLEHGDCASWLVAYSGLLYGRASKQLAQTLDQMTIHALPDNPNFVVIFYALVTFFHYRKGIDDLWGLLSACRGERAHSSFPFGAILHESDIVDRHRTEALQLAAQKQVIGISGRREDRLVTAAKTLLRIGDVQGYCTYMAMANQWEKAICLAPAVSMAFWQKLCAEYLETLSAVADCDQTAPLFIATENYDGYVNALLAQQELNEAFLVAKVAADNKYPPICTTYTTRSPAPEDGLHDGARCSGGSRHSIANVTNSLANHYFAAADPVGAALTRLAMSDVDGALQALDKGCEAVLLYVVAACLKRPIPTWCVERLGNTLEMAATRHGAGDQFANCVAAAWEMWKQHPRKEKVDLFLRRMQKDTFNVAQIEKLAVEAEQNDDHVELVRHLALIDPIKAVEVARVHLHRLFENTDGFDLAHSRLYLEPFEAIALETLPIKSIAEILTCAAYVGFLDAMQLGYVDIVMPLAQTFRNLVQHQHLSFPVSMDEVTALEQEYYRMTRTLEANGHPTNMNNNYANNHSSSTVIPSEPTTSSTHWFFTKMLNGGFARRTLVLTSANLPYGTSGTKDSVLTSVRIKGDPIALDDGKHFISAEEHEYWSRVNIFSPMNTGQKIRLGNIVN